MNTTGSIIVCREELAGTRVYFTTDRCYVRFNKDGTTKTINPDVLSYRREDVCYAHKTINVELVYESFVKSFTGDYIFKFDDKSVDEIITAIKIAEATINSAKESIDKMLSELPAEDKSSIESKILVQMLSNNKTMLKTVIDDYLRNRSVVIIDGINPDGPKYPEHMTLTLRYEDDTTLAQKLVDTNKLCTTFSNYIGTTINVLSCSDSDAVYKITNFSKTEMSMSRFIEKYKLNAVGYAIKKCSE